MAQTVILAKRLKLGKIEIEGKDVSTSPFSSFYMAKKIAEELKKWIENIEEPLELVIRKMEKGYISEIFSSFQGEGLLVGRRQIFIRFAGCPLACFYCDTTYSREKTKKAHIFKSEGEGCVEEKNPLPSQLVIEHVNKMITPDIHSISYTGGEPLMQPKYVREIAKGIKKMKLRNFIETNGYDERAFVVVCDYFDYASIDIKLREHRAIEDKNYERLYENELKCVNISVDRGLETIVKVVVTKNTEKKEIEEICANLSDLSIKFVIQPVTPFSNANIAVEAASPPDAPDLFLLSEAAGCFLKDKVMVIPQVHKFTQLSTQTP